MALTYTPEATEAQTLPEFTLPNISGGELSSQQISSAPAKLIMFICAHCPYVLAIEDRLIQLGQELKSQGIAVLGICSNDPADYPEDSPEALKKRAEDKGYSFDYLFDESQSVAKSFGAVCTPDFFVYDKSNSLVYRGRLDDSWKDPSKVTSEELKSATLKAAQGETINDTVYPSMGCSIKWKDS